MAPEKVNEIRRRLKFDYPLLIAQDMSIPFEAVMRIRNGIYNSRHGGGRKRSYSEDQRVEIIRMREAGAGVEEIYKKTGIRKYTIYKIFEREGIK